MNEFLLYIGLEPYLRQWFIHRHGGAEPVRLVRGSIESKRLRLLMDVTPSGSVPAMRRDGDTAVILPSFAGRDPRVYNYVGDAGVAAFIGTLRDEFDCELYDWMTRTHIHYRRCEQLIYAWMELHGIESTETNWCAVMKRYQRLRNRVYAAKNRAKKKEEKTTRKKS